MPFTVPRCGNASPSILYCVEISQKYLVFAVPDGSSSRTLSAPPGFLWSWLWDSRQQEQLFSDSRAAPRLYHRLCYKLCMSWESCKPQRFFSHFPSSLGQKWNLLSSIFTLLFLVFYHLIVFFFFSFKHHFSVHHQERWMQITDTSLSKNGKSYHYWSFLFWCFLPLALKAKGFSLLLVFGRILLLYVHRGKICRHQQFQRQSLILGP